MRRALAAIMVILSLSAMACFLWQDGGTLTHAEVIEGTVDAATASAGVAESVASPPGVPELVSTPAPIQVSPFQGEKERPEKLLVRIVTGPVGQEKLVLAADIRFQTGLTRRFGAEVLEDRQTTRRALSNRWGEASFALPRSGVWWLEVSKEGRCTAVQGSAADVQNGLLVVRLDPQCALRVMLEGVTERMEVEVGWDSIGTQQVLDGATDMGVEALAAQCSAAPFGQLCLAGPGEPVVLNPGAGSTLRVMVRCVAAGLIGGLELSPLAEGEVRDVKLTLQRACVVTAKLPPQWPADAEVVVLISSSGPHGMQKGERPLKATEDVRFLQLESGRCFIMAKRRQMEGISCAFKELDVNIAEGPVDAGFLEPGSANVHIKWRVADEVRTPREAILDLLLSDGLLASSGSSGWSHRQSFCPHTTREFRLHGMPAGFALNASLLVGNADWTWGFGGLQRQRAPESRLAARNKEGVISESTSERAQRLAGQCAMPQQRLVLAAGMNAMELAVKRKPAEERPSHLALNIAPPPAHAWRDNMYVVQFKAETVQGSSGCARDEGVWTQWFDAGIKEVEVLVTCGDHVIGPRTIQLNPGGEAEVSLEAWQSRDNADVSAAVDRFAPLLRARSPRSGK